MKKKKTKKPFVVRPWTLGKCPTAEEVIAAWQNRGNSLKDFIWCLSVLSELTCYADCNLRVLGGFGNIAGRAGGLKAHLADNIPALAPKYKSVSRYATLALRLRKAFNFYPPAVLAQLHPELPHPKQVNLPFIRRYCNRLYGKFKDLPPTYAAFNRVINRQMQTAVAKRPRGRPADNPDMELTLKHWKSRALFHPWGPALPREKWAEAEKNWRVHVVRLQSLQAIHHIRPICFHPPFRYDPE